MNLQQIHSFFFVGIAGTGMSAIAQYLCGEKKRVSGSDRLFEGNNEMLIQRQFRKMSIDCYLQDGSGISSDTDVVVVSTAIEESNPEYVKAVQLGIPVIKRSELLSVISESKKTIAIGGTSGKSTTTAMLFHVLQQCGIDVSLITGAGLIVLQEKGLPGNAWNGKSEWLLIEADESDGSIVNYKPEIGVLLNIDRDHKEYSELHQLFSVFRENTKHCFVVNQDNLYSRRLSLDLTNDFSIESPSGTQGIDFKQSGFSLSFRVGSTPFTIPVMGKHNMENALAVLSVCRLLDIPDTKVADAFQTYRGIYRRTQRIGEKRGVTVIDDFAHNPAEVVAAIKSCQSVGERVLAWFQPHGFGPLRFMHEELVLQIVQILRKNDIFLLSDVYYAGGTVNKNIQSNIVAEAIKKNNKQAVYLPEKDEIVSYITTNAQSGDIVLLMGARDPGLGDFALQVFSSL